MSAVKTVHVFVTPKEGVLDPQGKAIRQSLGLSGYQGIEDARLGKFIELKVANPNKKMLDEICERLLANTVIEDYRYEIVGP